MSDNLYLFANNNGGQAENNGSYRLYNMKIEGDPGSVNSGVNYVDYLEGDGASYIDTKTVLRNGYSVEIVYMLKSDAIKNENMIYGTGSPCGYSYDNQGGYGIGLHKTWSTIHIRDAGKGVFTSPYIEIKIKQDIKNIYKHTFINISSQTFPYLFANNNENTFDQISGKGILIYSFKSYDTSDNLLQDLRPCLDNKGVPCMYDEISKKYFYNKGTGTFGYKKTLRDFQPVLDSNNIPCLLDKINNKFYYNKGTGSFTYGGIQTPKDGYTEVEYIESNGTQYIDTGVVPNSNTDIDMTCRAVSNGGYILNKLQLDTTYKYNGTDTTAQPNLTASTGATLTMGSQNIAYLTEAEIAQAVLNGWTIQ